MNRAIDLGAIKGTRVSPRKFLVSSVEETYLRDHWRLLKELRWTLRNERNVRLAVLFGSVARGSENSRSDLDLLVGATDNSPVRLAALSLRLEDRFDRTVQTVTLEDAMRVPEFLHSIVEDGRVLVDRDRSWLDLRSLAAPVNAPEEELARLVKEILDGD